jgi:multidrug resistance efflux pump
METAATESETAARIDAFKADAEAQIAEVRAQLDTAVLEAQQAKSELDTFKAELAALAEAEAAQAAIEARRDERLARVKEVASFPEEYLTLNADRFAAMSDEDFEEKVAEWAMISSKTPAVAGGIPAKTALVAAREVTSDSGRILVREVMQDFRSQHIDPRSL